MLGTRHTQTTCWSFHGMKCGYIQENIRLNMLQNIHKLTRSNIVISFVISGGVISQSIDSESYIFLLTVICISE